VTAWTKQSPSAARDAQRAGQNAWPPRRTGAGACSPESPPKRRSRFTSASQAHPAMAKQSSVREGRYEATRLRRSAIGRGSKAPAPFPPQTGAGARSPEPPPKAAKPLHFCIAGLPRDGESIFGPRTPLRSYAAAPLCHRSGLESPGSCCATTKSHQYDKTANE